MFGTKTRAAKRTFKRENKNRPREISSKKPISRFSETPKMKKNVPRDPRFDSLCGTFNEKAFKNAYSFVSKLKERDLQALKKQLSDTEDPKEIKKIKYLIQRLENQLREEKKLKERQEKDVEEKHEIAEAIKQGEKPIFKKKCKFLFVLDSIDRVSYLINHCLTSFTAEKKILSMEAQYEELKNSGKLKKHMQRLRKKNLARDRKKFADMDT